MLCLFLFLHYQFSLCWSLDNFYWPVHLFLKSAESTDDLVNSMLHFCYCILVLAFNLIFLNSFYLLAEIPIGSCMLSTFSTRFFNILTVVIFNSLSHSSTLWFLSQSGSVDYSASWQWVCSFVSWFFVCDRYLVLESQTYVKDSRD